MKTYIICKENRIANSPFTIEGSNIPFDITNLYPIPVETVSFDDKGNPINIRFIMGCTTIIKEEQIQKGYAANRKPTDMERNMLTFVGGMLSVPEGYKQLEQYLEVCPWFKDKKGPRPVNSRVIFEAYDQVAIDDEIFQEEMLVTEARQYVGAAKRDQLISLLRLANPGGFIDPNMNLNTLRLRAMEMANNNPDFVLKGIRSAREEIVVVVSKAVDYGILNLDTTGKVMLKRRDSDKLQVIASVADVGGRHAKVDRTVSFLESEDGRANYQEVKKMVKEHEQLNGYLDDQDDDDDQDLDETPVVMAPKRTRKKDAVKQQPLPIGPQAPAPPAGTEGGGETGGGEEGGEGGDGGEGTDPETDTDTKQQ